MAGSNEKFIFSGLDRNLERGRYVGSAFAGLVVGFAVGAGLGMVFYFRKDAGKKPRLQQDDNL